MGIVSTHKVMVDSTTKEGLPIAMVFVVEVEQYGHDFTANAIEFEASLEDCDEATADKMLEQACIIAVERAQAKRERTEDEL